MKNAYEAVNSKIRKVPDFPKSGIIFKDIMPALRDAKTLAIIADWFADKMKSKGIDYVIGMEARGFIIAPLIAYKIGAGFIPARKPGKLPSKTHRITYALEYGSDSLEIQADAIEPGNRIAIVDDVLATGGTTRAAHELVERAGGIVICNAFLIELQTLGGRNKLPPDSEIFSLIKS